jgi:hypothetical protein
MPLVDFLGIVLVLGLVPAGLVWALAVANKAGTPASDGGEHERSGAVPAHAYRDPRTGEWIEL